MTTNTQRGVRAFRNELLPGTIANAAGMAFYAEHWAGVDVGSVTSVADLARLPMTDKELYRSSFQFRPPYETELASIGHTTGTTGDLVFRHRSAEEIAEQHAFFRAGIEGARAPGAPRRLVALIGSPGHGVAIRPPTDGLGITGTLDDPHRVDQVRQIMTRSFKLPGYTDRVVEVQSSPQGVEMLTLALLGCGVDPLDLPVDRIIVVSAYVSAAFRTFVRETWGEKVRLIDRYSLSEIVGGATNMPCCGAFHPDPHVVVELVDPVTREATGPGDVAVTVLTELYPLVRYQPLVRYWTDDVVERVECAAEPLAFVVHGRRHEVPLRRRERTEVLVSTARLQDHLQTLPGVARARLVQHLPGVAPVRIGPAVATVTHTPPEVGGAGVVAVTVSVTFNTSLHAAAARALVSGVEQRVVSDNPALAEAIDAGEYRLAVSLGPPQ